MIAEKMTHMLITVCGRDIMTGMFAGLQLAHDAMKKELIREGNAPEDITIGYDDGDCGLDDYSAYARNSVRGYDFDWLIVPLE